MLSVLCRKAALNTDGKELEGSFKKVGKGKCQVYLIKQPLVFPIYSGIVQLRGNFIAQKSK